MADGGEDCSDWLRSWNQFEQQCVEEVEGEGNMEERLAGEREDVAQKLWLSFQNSATAVAQLYKDRGQGSHVWQVFQNAAQAVTLLYKDSIDANKRSDDFGIQCGYQRRTRDVVAWAKKRRRHIRREELLAFLCGKTVPSRTGSRSPPRSTRDSPRLGSQEYAPSHQSEIDLQPFKDAIALQGLNGAMASFGLRTPTSPSHNMHSTPSRRRNLGELHAFISEEFANHMDSNSPNGRKRSSGNDILGDSPVHKRSRHL
ncbi:C16orf72 [Branchiostoma lanceolatum]|uniref:C16orf72 protein n=1 Tax=Branchiostoma lanceolatum TaxID=7740 RepID=A0A8K0ADA6_BRALA|nr:C16orf72 [Branchiostoma lanceolatum]